MQQTTRPQQQMVPSGDFGGYFITPSGEAYYGKRRSAFDRKVSRQGYEHQVDRMRRGKRRGMFWRDGVTTQQQQPMYGSTYNNQSHGDSYAAQDDDPNYGDDYHGEDGYGEDYQDGYADSFDEEYQQQSQSQLNSKQPLNQVVPSDMPAHHAVFANMSNEELALSTSAKFRKVTFEASREIKPSQFIDKETKKLRNRGELVFSVDNGRLEPISASHKPDVFGVKHTSKAKEDLVKRIDISILSDYKGKLLLSLPTVGAIGTELFRNGANHVNFTIPAGALSLDEPYKLSFERDISNGVVAYTTMFDSASPDTLEDKICHVSGRDYSLVPFTSTVVDEWNREHMNDGLAFTKAHADAAGDVRMKTTEAKRLAQAVRERVTAKVSLGNVTTDPVIIISAIEPVDSKQMSLRAKENGENGGERAYQFLGLADANYYLGKNATEAKKMKFMETPFKFDLTAAFEYLRVDGKSPIEFNK